VRAPVGSDDGSLSLSAELAARQIGGTLNAMGRHVSDLTIKELAKAGADAAHAAVSDALAAGVAVTGYLSDEAGNVWLVRQQPDGQTEWLELVEAAVTAEPTKAPAPKSKLAS
jgi:hypothetical protein